MAVSIKCPKVTPWGEAQTAEQIAPGIWLISTAGHGGIWCSPERVRKFPKAVLDSTFVKQGYKGWFEEDCDAVKVGQQFPVEFAAWRASSGR